MLIDIIPTIIAKHDVKGIRRELLEYIVNESISPDQIQIIKHSDQYRGRPLTFTYTNISVLGNENLKPYDCKAKYVEARISVLMMIDNYRLQIMEHEGNGFNDGKVSLYIHAPSTKTEFPVFQGRVNVQDIKENIMKTIKPESVNLDTPNAHLLYSPRRNIKSARKTLN